MSKHEEIDPDALAATLDEVQAWAGQSGEVITALDFAQLAGSAGLLCAYAALLAPDLVEVEGRWFLRDKFSRANYDNWVRNLGDRAHVQMMMNHLHLSSFLQNGASDESIEMKAAEMLRAIWQKTLPASVTITLGSPDDFGGVSITFHQDQ